ncbi:MAG: transcriptional regulator [Candidatus Bathyarchaeota archaeon B26-2]|nr:MAG: transcriptional regulator [Candidatus Bathyarchaeota archaeon B26-2]
MVRMSFLACIDCGSAVEPYPPKYKCPVCGGLLEYRVEPERLRTAEFSGPLTFWRYRSLLPEVKNLVTMNEGGTPLHVASRLADRMDVKSLRLKDETRNPTNSFRDRSAALLLSNAIDMGYKALICATNGNMGASLAAYCAKYGLICHVLIPKVMDMGKLAQMLIYDAIIEEHGETVDKPIEKAERLASETGWYQATPELNPLAVEAQKTISYEVSEQMGVPDWFIVSMGSGGTIYSIWKGFMDLQEMGKTDSVPRMVGVQAEGCSPIVDSYLKIGEEKRRRAKPLTHAVGILVKKPLQREMAIRAIKESNGIALSVSDQEIFQAEQAIARLEGMFAEPASSATIAALKRMRDGGVLDPHDRVVCLITGSGLKATDVLQALAKRRKTVILGAEFSTKERILRILSQRDAYGYEIWKALGRMMTRVAVYQHLNDLEKKGLTTTYSREKRKYFRITERGRRILQMIDELKILL